MFYMIGMNQLIWFIALPAFIMMQGSTGDDKTLSQAISQAEKDQRQLMLYFTSKPCSNCKAVNSYFDLENVQKALSQHYVVVQVDIDDFDGRACREIYDIDEIPALVVVDFNGNLVYKAEGNATKEDVETIVATGNLPDHKEKKLISTTTGTNAYPASSSKDEILSIQVGYFSSAENAERLKDQVMSEVYIETTVREEKKIDQTYYRVLVGDYAGADIAEVDIKKLEKSGFSVKMHKYRP